MQSNLPVFFFFSLLVWLPLKQSLWQELIYRAFIWKVISGSRSKGKGRLTWGKIKSSIKVYYRGCCHKWQRFSSTRTSENYLSYLPKWYIWRTREGEQEFTPSFCLHWLRITLGGNRSLATLKGACVGGVACWTSKEALMCATHLETLAIMLQLAKTCSQELTHQMWARERDVGHWKCLL